MSHLEHRKDAPRVVRCFVLTISDTRTEETDTGGQAIRELVEEAGHVITGTLIVRDEPELVRQAIDTQIDAGETQAIITTGGTGISSRDSTYEAINALIDKRLDGFGELFRMLSYAEIGSAAILSRALAGTVRGRLVFALPGSVNAVRLAMTKLILPEIGHLVREVRR